MSSGPSSIEIREKYSNSGGLSGPLGARVGDEKIIADGGRIQRFEYGTVFWSAFTGAHIVAGDILAAYMTAGAERSTLGFPISDVEPTTHYRDLGDRQVAFEAGFIIENSRTHEIHILHFQSLGSPPDSPPIGAPQVRE